MTYKERVLNGYKESKKSMSPSEVAKLTQTNLNTARRVVQELYKEGLLIKDVNITQRTKYKITH